MKIGVCLSALVLAVTSAMAQPPPAKVVIMRVFEKEMAPTSRIIGVVDFDKRSGISSELSGLIDHQDMAEGRVVKKGDVLAGLNRDFIVRDIDILATRLQRIDIKIENTLKNLKRYETLFKQDAASEKAYDDLVHAHRELIKDKEIIAKQIEKRRLEIAKSDIRAPFDGLILEKFKHEGEWVSPGMAICSLAAVDEVVVKVAAPEDLSKFIRPDMAVSVTIDALGKAHDGSIKTIVPVADLSSKTFQIKIAVPYYEGIIRNMSASADVPAGDKTTLMMIKRDALVRFQGNNMVYTVKDDKAVVMPVRIVAFEGEYAGVEKGMISKDMPVVVEGNDRLRPNQPVVVVKEIPANE